MDSTGAGTALAACFRRVFGRRPRGKKKIQAEEERSKMRSTATVEVPVEKFRKDYKPTDFMAKDIDLTFQINDGATNARTCSAR